jgi:predicted nucleic acid-binding protein
MQPRKVVFDTNILIDYLEFGRLAEVVERDSDKRYLSAVVIKELRQGISKTSSRRIFRTTLRAFDRISRILVPGWRTYERAGALLRDLAFAGFESKSASAFADVLIALSAKEIGATVVTRDRDFERLRKFEDFALELVP